MCKVNNDARKETRFGHTEKEAREVELQWRANKRGQRRNETPRDEDARKPFARAPPFHKQRARNLENEITDKEDTDTEAKNLLGKLQVAGHAQFGEANVGAVEIGNDIKQEDQRQNAQGHFAADRVDLVHA